MVTHTKDRHSSFLVLNIPHKGGYRLSRYGDTDTLRNLCRCLFKREKESKSVGSTKQAAPAPVLPTAPKAKKGGCKLEVPPKLVFSMLKDRELSNKLKALRLPTEGRRQVGPPIASILVSYYCTHWLIPHRSQFAAAGDMPRRSGGLV